MTQLTFKYEQDCQSQNLINPNEDSAKNIFLKCNFSFDTAKKAGPEKNNDNN